MCEVKGLDTRSLIAIGGNCIHTAEPSDPVVEKTGYVCIIKI